jgi:hypothetical protein
MNSFLNRLLNAAKKFTLWDYGFFKIVLVSLGILLGTYFSKFFLSYTSLLWIIFIASYILVLYRIIKHMH